MEEPKDKIQKMIDEGELIPAQWWDFYINGNGKDKMLNIGLQVYLQSFHTDEYSSYQIRMDYSPKAIGDFLVKVMPWVDAGKAWIHKSERHVTINNDPVLQKEMRRKKKIAQTGMYMGDRKESII